MSSVLPTDKTLVQRGTTLHSAPADMSTVQDTDLLLINRAGVDYKCSFADWKASQVSVAKPRITTPAAGAVDLGETPTFTSSAFSGTGTTHASSDWQVTLKTDTAFASPVVQSMADTAHLLSWDGGPLQPNTDYIARVRHNGSGGVISPWSDAVGFKTKDAFSTIVSKPGQLWSVHGSTGALAYRTAPARLTVLSITDSVLAVGANSVLYQAADANNNLTPHATPVTLSYVPISAVASYGQVPTLFAKPDGRLAAYKLDGTLVSADFEIAAGVKVASLSLSSSESAVAALTSTGDIYLAVGVAAGTTGWTLVSTGAQAGQFKYVSYGASYLWDGTGTTNGVVLAVKKDGTLWELSPNSIGGTGTWTNTGVTGVAECCTLFRTGLYYYAISTDGSTIRVGGSMPTAAGTVRSFSAPAGDAFIQVGGTYKTGIFLTKKGRVFVHNTSGCGYTPIIGTAAADGNALTEIAVPKPVSSLSMQQTTCGGYALGFIIPD